MAGKGDVIERIASDQGITKAEAGRYLTGTIDAISSFLVSGESVSIPGFGTFGVRVSAEREGRNPATGEAMMIGPRARVHFRAGSQLRSMVRAQRDE